MAQVDNGGWFGDVALRGIDFGPGRWHRRGIEGRPDVLAERVAALLLLAVTRKRAADRAAASPLGSQPSNYHRILSYLGSVLLCLAAKAETRRVARARKPPAREPDVCGGERCGPHELATDVAEPLSSRATRDHRVVVLPASSA